MVILTSSSPNTTSSADIIDGMSEMGYAASLNAEISVEPAYKQSESNTLPHAQAQDRHTMRSSALQNALSVTLSDAA